MISRAVKTTRLIFNHIRNDNHLEAIYSVWDEKPFHAAWAPTSDREKSYITFYTSLYKIRIAILSCKLKYVDIYLTMKIHTDNV